ncbi:MAG: Gfo/Idh/MocA family oxidoreductase [Bacteroidales bacterium]|nr:MAG: Gfo/Idh/MocA family oxidoreductase [Bacteroidales bacterium]
MKKDKGTPITRRNFLTTSGSAIAGTLLSSPAKSMFYIKSGSQKKRVALVGTGIRGITYFGKTIADNYNDIVEFVGLCDINPGRLQYAKEYIGVNCPVFTDFDEMMKTVPMDLLMVTTVDSTHDEFIIKGLDHGVDVVTEKPMTTDEIKCRNIVEAQRKSDNKIIMAFNYRYGQLFTELKKILNQNKVGRITSVDFNWYLNVYHGASYFRRWHGIRAKSGTLLLHKSAHHFDLLNWFINSDPVEVHAYGELEHYGKNNEFRGNNCRDCPHIERCKFYWDMTKNERYMKLYAANEKYDGYIRDNCLWREEIDIFDKMAVQIKYANNLQVAYSLTAYSPFEGFRLAFNGMDGRIETWEGIPWREEEKEDQSQIYNKEMDQSHVEKTSNYHEIVVNRNFTDYERIKLPYIRRGHWGADKIMQDKILRAIDTDKALHHAANVRDGAMAILIGVAARKSIDEGRVVKISELTDIQPRTKVHE